ncbi:ATP-binding protein [Actinomadura viridis]|uniref:ATP-binding protein n=1 Tax=Actinomadura viridis TaxID=58110 RepID=UPI003687F684
MALHASAPDRWTLLTDLSLPGLPQVVPPVRARVRAAVEEVLDDRELVEDVVLATAELLTNALDHTRSGQDGGRVDLTVTLTPASAVLVEVTDQNGTDTHPRPTSGEALSDRGRGLHIVEAVSALWGVRSRPDRRTTVWFATADRSASGRSVRVWGSAGAPDPGAPDTGAAICTYQLGGSR